MKLSISIKRQITEDWAKCFPALGTYKPMWLLRRTGPLLQGICLNRDSGNDAYRPTFHVHNLAKNLPFISLTLATPLRTVKTGAPETIRAAFHKERFADAADRLRRQTHVPLAGPVDLNDYIRAYRAYMAEPLASYPSELFEDIVTLFVWCNESAKAESALHEFQTTMTHWPPSVQPDGSLEAWVKQCRLWLNSPDRLQDAVKSQTKVLRLEHLPYSDIQS